MSENIVFRDEKDKVFKEGISVKVVTEDLLRENDPRYRFCGVGRIGIVKQIWPSGKMQVDFGDKKEDEKIVGCFYKELMVV